MYNLSHRRHARREASYGPYNPWGRGPARRAGTDIEAMPTHPPTDDYDNHLQQSKSMPENPTHTINTSLAYSDAIPKQRRPVADDSPGTPIHPATITLPDSKDETSPAKDDLGEDEEPDDSLKEGRWKRLYRKMFLDEPIPVGQQLKTVLFPSWYTINWLLVAIPVGIALHLTHQDPLAVFIVNFVAIVPLAAMLGMATEELALRVGEVIGGLLNASFGNAVELIVGVIALAKHDIIIVQTSLIGSMLSNLLLVLGMCFFAGGITRVEQFFNTTVAQTAASLLALAVGSLIIPTAYTWSHDFIKENSTADEQLSRGTSIILLFVYGAYLTFQLYTHRAQYNEPSQKVKKRTRNKDMKRALAQAGGTAATHAGRDSRPIDDPMEEPEEPSLTFVGAILTLLIATALIGVCAEFLVDSINEVTCKYKVSQYFVGLILLPIVGNAAEHATAVTVAARDKMDLAIGVAVGSSMQIALLVLPLMVVIGWGIHADMTLLFDNFQIAVLFVSVILVNYLIADGKSHWLDGILLISLYIIIAVAAWFYPQTPEEQRCKTG